MAAEVGPTDLRFVGREGELRRLVAAFDRARAGHGCLVAVSGDAGIGKTRLVEELARATALPPGRVFRGRCLDQEGAPSYWPWVRVLRAYVAARGLDEARTDMGADAAVFGALVPELLQEGAAASAAIASGSDLEARYRLFEATSNLLRVVSEAPALMALEDLHWADEASLALLEFVAHELDRTHLLLVVTYRDRARPRLPRPLVGALRCGKRIALRGLDGAAVTVLAEEEAGATLPAALVERLAEVTGGNPFFLGEVLRALKDEGQLEPSLTSSTSITLPETVRESIRRRLEPLPTPARDLLALAAVAGQEFDVPVLQLAADTEAAAVLERLNAPVEHGIVVEKSPGRFAFVHALVRETIYGDVLPAARVRLHARVGDALERVHGDRDDGPLAALASHFVHAARLGVGSKAAGYAARAGRQAAAVYAYHDALLAYEQALAVLGADPADRARRLELRLEAATAASRAGYDPRARQLFQQAAHDARALSDGVALFRAAVGHYLASPLESDPQPETARLLEDALDAIGDGDSPVRAMLLGLLAVSRHLANGGFGHEALSLEAVEMARRSGLPQPLAVTLVLRQFVSLRPGSTTERLALCDEALALTAGAEPETQHAAGLGRTCGLLELGDVEGAIAEVDRAGRRADRLRQTLWQWQVAVQRAAIALLQGEFDDGARLAAEALAARRNASDSRALETFILQMFLARRDTGLYGGLEGSLRWMVQRSPDAQMWRCILAVFLADLGRGGEARAVFEGLAREGFADLRHDQRYPAMLAWLARVCVFLRDAPRALQLYPLLLPYADRNIVVSVDSRACLGSTHRYLGLLAWTVGLADAAAVHFEAALAMNERMGARPQVACCQHEYARVLQLRNGPGDRKHARELLARARVAARACGLGLLLEWIERLGPVEPEAEPRATSAPAAVAAASAPAVPAAATVAILRRDGDVWVVGFAGETARLKDARGLHLLATLLGHPGQDIHALDLASGGAGAVADRGDAGPLLDPAARAAYQRRLEDLRDEVEEAERFADPERATRAREEIDFLAEELARGVGLGGRDRRAASAAERARINATRTIRKVVKRIATANPRLGEHLRATVRTGYLCTYAPDPASPVRWEL